MRFMSGVFGHLRFTAVGLAWALVSGAPAAADDTEVFRFAPPRDTRANVLFVIDDSLSMGAEVLTQPAYDAAVSYPSQGCDAARVYWSAGTGAPPSCTTPNWFNATAQSCDKAARAFAASGRFWDDHMAQYDPSGSGTWRDLASSQKDRVVECHDDRGAHGHGGALYAANNFSPNAWRAASAEEISWSARDEATLYSGNYLNWYYGAVALRPRLDVVQNVVDDLLETLDGVNVGLMHFNAFADPATGSDGGSILVPVADIATNRTALQEAVASLTPNASSPLAETLYEARQYFAGNAVTFGSASVLGSRAVADTDFYDSPIEEACQQNFVVLLTDGEPTWDNEADEAILSLRDAGNASLSSVTGSAVCDVETWTGIDAAAPPSGELSHCLDDVAHFLYEGDVSSAHDDTQRVRTFTVGFTVDAPVLEATAERGNGRAPGDSEGVYFVANDAASLASAFSAVVGSITATAASFVAPAVAANVFQRAETLSDLFVSVFQPSENLHWPGNLKKYRLRDDGVIVDARNAPAVDPATGLFADATQSYWSATFDGTDVTKGGAANLIPPSREVYTNVSGHDLNAPGNRVSIANTAEVTDAMLGVEATGWTRDDVISFINGINPLTGLARNEMGDPLHSAPVPVIYGPDLRDGLVFVATNDGFLHALDASTGVERWAFLPREFLDDQIELLDNDASSGKHYAIDGPLRIQTLADDDGVIEPGEKVYLFVGMRRGGDFYYALDISVPSDPQLLWRRDATQWEGLGESWSAPVPTRVRIGSTEYRALVIGGGYENDQDHDESTTDATGNSIYIVESATGDVLWRGTAAAGPGVTKTFGVAGRSMDYSFPSEIKVIDLNGDGLMDRMYAADMGGQLWRFDVTNGAAAADLVAGGVIAQLGAAGDATPTLAENRRFYYSPDVALVNTRLASFIHLGIGSGHRAHPLGAVNADRFYAIRDKNVGPLDQSQLDALTIVRDADLRPITSADTTMLATDLGWRLDLMPGEKVLAEARTINNEVFFTTFRPGNVTGGCRPQPGLNRLYRMSLFNGAPVANLDGSADDDALTLSDLFVEHTGTIPSTPQVLFVSRDGDNDGIPDDADAADDDDGSSVDEPAGDRAWVCTDRICVPLELTNSPVRTYWLQSFD